MAGKNFVDYTIKNFENSKIFQNVKERNDVLNVVDVKVYYDNVTDIYENILSVKLEFDDFFRSEEVKKEIIQELIKRLEIIKERI